jgi:hypothetical protein
MNFDIKTNFPDVQRALAQLRTEVASKATASALNKTIEQARTQMIREITSEFAVKAGFVRERLRISRASPRPGALNLQVSLSGTGKISANVIAFGAREVGTGVSVKIKKAGGRKIITGAFIGNKGRTVFERIPGTTMGSRSRYAGSKHANKIKAVATINVPQMFNTKRINAKVLRFIEDKFPTIFANEAKFFTDRFKAGK